MATLTVKGQDRSPHSPEGPRSPAQQRELPAPAERLNPQLSLSGSLIPLPVAGEDAAAGTMPSGLFASSFPGPESEKTKAQRNPAWECMLSRWVCTVGVLACMVRNGLGGSSASLPAQDGCRPHQGGSEGPSGMRPLPRINTVNEMIPSNSPRACQ